MLDPRHLRSLLDGRGGFTLDPSTGIPVDRGVSVCLDPRRSTRFSRGHWRDEHVAAWLDAHRDELSRNGRYVGGWLDTATAHVWLDVVRVMPEMARPAAVLLARWCGQHCVYDLGRSRLLPASAHAS